MIEIQWGYYLKQCVKEIFVCMQNTLAEIKLGGQKLIEEGVANLKMLANKIDTSKMPAPAFLMIIVGIYIQMV